MATAPFLNGSAIPPPATEFTFSGAGGILSFKDIDSMQTATIPGFAAGDTIDMPSHQNATIAVNNGTVAVHPNRGSGVSALLDFAGGAPTDLVAEPDMAGGIKLIIQGAPTPLNFTVADATKEQYFIQTGSPYTGRLPASPASPSTP